MEILHGSTDNELPTEFGNAGTQVLLIANNNNIFHRRLCQARMFPTSPSRQGGEPDLYGKSVLYLSNKGAFDNHV